MRVQGTQLSMRFRLNLVFKIQQPFSRINSLGKEVLDLWLLFFHLQQNTLSEVTMTQVCCGIGALRIVFRDTFIE